MSIRNLDSLFDPASIAVFGASLRVGSVGATVWRNLSSSHAAGTYKGQLFAVNPKRPEIEGYKVVAHAADLPEVPALAVICTPPDTVAGLVGELGRTIGLPQWVTDLSPFAHLSQLPGGDFEALSALVLTAIAVALVAAGAAAYRQRDVA